MIFRFGFIHLKVIALSIPFLQEKVTTAVDQFVRATEMVNSLGLFSTNEAAFSRSFVDVGAYVGNANFGECGNGGHATEIA